MKDKVPSKITGFFISVIGTGVILRFLSVIIDRVFFFNSEFTLKDYEDLGLVIFIISIFIGILWLYRIKNISD
ncbi:MAG: hypothetical protein L7S06_01860 [Candidatus Actinomarina sp.]|jgi:hypothetical protein|nr:hypothetical protein [Candidatus Actinomarina sp.]|tara:strand:+ start:657 stop:875 length:219 start_codon:yes stop_codon:yes gene_type:complete